MTEPDVTEAIENAPAGSTIVFDEPGGSVEIMKPDENGDVTEKVERTETGYRLTIESTRGTGTRDQDKVKVEARTETLDKLEDQQLSIRSVVKMEMDQRRLHHPDNEE